MSRAYFNETQRFKQWWIYLVIGITIVSWGYTLIYSQMTDEADKASDHYLLIITGIIPVLLIWLLLSLRLVTRIRNEGIYVQFKPLQFKEKHIKKEEIKSFEVRKYNPILEYGGWGLRSGMRIGRRKSGTAYNVSGNMGLQLYLVNGKKLLIGTQMPADIQKAMEVMMESDQQTFDN